MWHHIKSLEEIQVYDIKATAAILDRSSPNIYGLYHLCHARASADEAMLMRESSPLSFMWEMMDDLFKDFTQD